MVNFIFVIVIIVVLIIVTLLFLLIEYGFGQKIYEFASTF
jgi:hypothetical protein